MKDWRWLSREDQDRRFKRILYFMNQGLNKELIGQRVNLTGARVGQILKENGYSR